MKAIGTTYNVPRIRRGKSCPKISHIANRCRTKHAAQKTQNSQEFRFLRPNIRRPNNAQKVHMTAACHLCGGLLLSRMIIATNPSAMPTQPKTSSLATLSFSLLGISDTSHKRYRPHKPWQPCLPTFRRQQRPWGELGDRRDVSRLFRHHGLTEINRKRPVCPLLCCPLLCCPTPTSVDLDPSMLRTPEENRFFTELPPEFSNYWRYVWQLLPLRVDIVNRRTAAKWQQAL